MYIPTDYNVAVGLMFITMLCWGSWANTQKINPSWRFELFYWDYTIGVILGALALGLTLGSSGATGIPFIESVTGASSSAIGYALAGGAVFNVANILLVAAIAIAGMSVAFPVGIGIALVLGTLANYFIAPQGILSTLLTGVGLILLAIIVCAKAYKKIPGAAASSQKGIAISVISGVLMGAFYPLVTKSMEGVGALTPYASLFYFAMGVFLCYVLIGNLVMKKPVVGKPVDFGMYLAAKPQTHLIGILGGLIWCVGMGLNIVAAANAGPAIAYAFGQGATLIAAIWGVFIWREFKTAKRVNGLLTIMFLSYIGGIILIGLAK